MRKWSEWNIHFLHVQLSVYIRVSLFFPFLLYRHRLLPHFQMENNTKKKKDKRKIQIHIKKTLWHRREIHKDTPLNLKHEHEQWTKKKKNVKNTEKKTLYVSNCNLNLCIWIDYYYYCYYHWWWCCWCGS